MSQHRYSVKIKAINQQEVSSIHSMSLTNRYRHDSLRCKISSRLDSWHEVKATVCQATVKEDCTQPLISADFRILLLFLNPVSRSFYCRIYD